MKPLKAPFPFFGGKSRVAHIVWAALGDVPNYVEPFFGSGAVFLARPHPHKVATLNDKDGLIVNFWRAIKHAPEETARWAAWPISENDLHARHVYIVQRLQDLAQRLEADPDFYDARIAGYWVYGMSAWIGGGFCSGKGPWVVQDGKLVKAVENECGEEGINRKRPNLGGGRGVFRNIPCLVNSGQGIHRIVFRLGSAGSSEGSGVIFNERRTQTLIAYFNELAERFAVARITCGDWSRVCGPSPTYAVGLTGIFLDPPYSGESGRDENIYREESLSVAHDVREWCLANGDNPKMRIVLAGYEGEGHEELEKAGWSVFAWRNVCSYGRKNSRNQQNRYKERLWFSPHCLGIGSLWGTSETKELLDCRRRYE